MKIIDQIELFIKKYFFILLALFAGIFILGQMVGFNFSKLPGDLGDTRFNQYVLEHFYQFITQNVNNFWSAPFYYPYRNTIAFSDSHIGSAPIYAIFRFAGFNQNTSLQIWIIIGFISNYLIAAMVLIKLNLKPMSAALGAFLFSFGLPVLAQENHIQLTYRFCVPVASFLFWRFANKPKFTFILFFFMCITLQLYFSIYIGAFLIILIIIMIFITPVFLSPPSRIRFLDFWRNLFANAWKNASQKERKVVFLGLIMCVFLMGILLIPHYSAAKIYSFSRSPEEILMMLPRPQSYFFADHSRIWGWLRPILPQIPMRHEHQLFLGLSTFILLFLGFMSKKFRHNRKVAFFNIVCAILIIGSTLRIGDFSIYKYFAFLPMFNSIRSVSRIILVLIWPISIFISTTFDSILGNKNKNIFQWLLLFITSLLLIIESMMYNHSTYFIKESQERLNGYYRQIEETDVDINGDVIIYVGSDWNEKWYFSELDGMVLAQELGVSTLNGYSGNFPYENQPSQFCDQISYRIQSYMNFEKIEDPNFYYETISRILPINMDQCDFFWFK